MKVLCVLQQTNVNYCRKGTFTNISTTGVDQGVTFSAIET